MDASDRGSGGRILVVEDNELNMKLFRDLLVANSFTVLETRDGVEVPNIARAEAPDLIVMDIQLPEVSGLEIARWIKDDDELSHIPIIAVTAFAMKGDEEKMRKGGCDAYLAKPISVAPFLEKVRELLSIATATAS